MTMNEPLQIRRVANGFIVELLPSPRLVTDLSAGFIQEDQYVFRTLEEVATFFEEHFTSVGELTTDNGSPGAA